MATAPKKAPAKKVAAKKPAAKKPAAKRTTSAAKGGPKIDPKSRAGRAQARIKDAQANLKSTASARRGQVEDVAKKLTDEAKALRGKAGQRARDYSTTGKDKVADGLGGLAGYIKDAARLVDENLGKDYGDYVRSASGKVSGAGSHLKSKNVDELVDEVASLVKRNPAITIGVVAAVGFALTRMFRSGGGGDFYDDEA